MVGKRFVIISIEQVLDGGWKAAIKPYPEENGRLRILNLNPVRENEASGIEMDLEGKLLEDSSGYLLVGNKPLKDWEPGDIVAEELYPVNMDN